jgi:hypothetical protein
MSKALFRAAKSIMQWLKWLSFDIVCKIKKNGLFCWNSWKGNDRGANKSLIITRPKIPLNERKCIFCNKNSVEDEIHFLLDCDFYSDLRYALTENVCISHDYQKMKNK